MSATSAHANVLVGSSHALLYCRVLLLRRLDEAPDTVGAPPPRRLPHVTNPFPFFEFFLALVFRVYQAHVKAWERGYRNALRLINVSGQNHIDVTCRLLPSKLEHSVVLCSAKTRR